MALLEELREAVVDGQAKLAVAKVTEGLDAGIEAGTLLREGLIEAMAQVGKLYEEGEVFVPEMLVAARAMTAALGVLKPHLVEEGVASRGKVAIGTTQGDLHDIGKNLVAMMLEGSGYEIVDLGVDVPPDKFIDAVQERGERGGDVGAFDNDHDQHAARHRGDHRGGAQGQGAHHRRRGAHHQVLCRRDRGGRLRGGRLQRRATGERGACRLKLGHDFEARGSIHRAGADPRS